MIHEALCARRTRITSAVKRVDFSLSSALSFNNINITRYLSKLKAKKKKKTKRSILCGENGLRSDHSEVDEYLQV